jgi:Fic family protein
MSESSDRVPVPPHEMRQVPWRQAYRGGSIDDRKLRRIEVAIPPEVGDLDPSPHGRLAAACDRAVRAIAALDATRGDHLRPLATLLLRAESVASSKIEHEAATVEDFARALHGVRSNSSAIAMVAAAGAIDRLLHGPLELETITSAHKRLMADDPRERSSAGRWRALQNWIGGSDYSPRGALYVPPPADLVEPAMRDLVRFANRTDVPVVAQAAIVHAQFESIHPFIDGNGRIGRALAAAVMRERGVARHIVVPIASALVSRRQHYFDALDAYRRGDAAPIIEAFARSAVIAAEEGQVTADRLDVLPGEFRAVAGSPRRGTATAALLDSLATDPVFTADDVEHRLRIPAASLYRAIARLRQAGVIRPLTDRTRDQIWGAGDLLDELNDLAVRIEMRADEL